MTEKKDCLRESSLLRSPDLFFLFFKVYSCLKREKEWMTAGTIRADAWRKFSISF